MGVYADAFSRRRILQVATAALGATRATTRLPRALAAAELPLRVVLPDAPATLDPHRAVTTADRVVARQLFEPLLRFGVEPAPEPAAAETARAGEDATQWTFSLRAGLRWADGTPLSAADYVRGWLRVLSLETPEELYIHFRPIFGAGVYRHGLVDPEVVGLRAPDPQTLEVVMDGPAGHFPHVAALWLGAPAHPAGKPAPGTRSGNGPYVLAGWDAEHLRLEPNPYYWAGPPSTALALLTTPDLAAEALSDYAAALAGGADGATGVGGAGGADETHLAAPAAAAVPADVVPVPEALHAAVLRDDRLQPLLVRQPRPATLWLACNTTRKPLDDAQVRKALAYAIDREAFVQEILGGAGRPTHGLLPAGVLGHDPTAGSVYQLRPDVAEAILAAVRRDEAEWDSLAVTVPATAEGRRAGDFLRRQLGRHLGVRLGVKELDRYSYARALERKQYDLAFGGWESAYPDPEAWFWLVFGRDKAENRTGWGSAVLDALWRRADEVADPARRIGLYAAAQQVLLDEMPVIFLAQPERLAVVHPRVVGLTPSIMDEIPGTSSLGRVRLRPESKP